MQWIPKTEMNDIIELRFTAYAIIKSKKMMDTISDVGPPERYDVDVFRKSCPCCNVFVI